jgi:peptidoglycan/LPS O-acetylase OafA/YrhL
MSIAFRSEIAGLRAMAVAGVVLFHLKVPGFQGGFVGVDVFFVISGYLITRNILVELAAGSFSFGEFYLRRTRRIYPALIVTVLATYLIGALWCSPLMFLDLAKESTHAILSISNIQYWREFQQYFAPESDYLALLHCWSLSLEEQFYLLWPALLLLAARSGRPFAIIAMSGGASLALSIIVAKTDPSAAFFLMPCRIFEFAIGAMVLAAERVRPVLPKPRFFSRRLVSEALSATGLLAILASGLWFRPNMPGAELAVLLPCIGTALVIWSGGRTWAAAVLTNRVSVALGAISYSLYLCHWPVIFFARFIFGEAAESASALLIMAAIMVGLATAMHRWIERRFLQGALPPAYFRRYAAGFATVIVAIAALTHTTFVARGFSWRLHNDEAELVTLYSASPDIPENPGPIAFALAGDSYAAQYVAGLSPLMGELSMGADVRVYPGCPLLYTTVQGAGSPECRKWHDQTLAALQKTNLPLILAQRWDNYTGGKAYLFEAPEKGSTPLESLRQALETTLEHLAADGRRILIIGDQVWAGCPVNPSRVLSGPLPHAPVKPCPPGNREAIERSSAAVNQMLESVQAKWPGQVSVLRPVDYFCDVNCPVVKDGIWLYYDRNHFNIAGSNYMVERSKAVFRDFLAGQPPPRPSLRADRS